VTIRCLRSLIMTNPTKLVPNLSHICGVLVTLFQWKRPRTQQFDHMPPTVARPMVTHNEKNVCDYMHIVTHFWRDQYNFLYQWSKWGRRGSITPPQKVSCHRCLDDTTMVPPWLIRKLEHKKHTYIHIIIAAYLNHNIA
jgi:hypothetical protein